MKEHYLNEVSHTKYLGVLVDKRLTWSNHIDHITSKANKVLGFLQRNLISCPMQVSYSTFVWPILDYCSTIWSPYTMSNINKIEAIQRRAARFVFKDFAYFSSATSMLCSLSWPTLREHRCSLKLLMLYKIINQLVDISPASYLKRTTCLSQRHNCCYQQLPTRTEAHANSFFHQLLNYGTI